jgi:predicted nucleic acid-binding protein
MTFLSFAATPSLRQHLSHDSSRHQGPLSAHAPTPDIEATQWLDHQPRNSVWTTAITVFEIRFGLQVMTTGKRRSLLMAAFDRLLTEMIQQRIAYFDRAAAQQVADLMATRQNKGRVGELRDTMAAGVALASHATGNVSSSRTFRPQSLIPGTHNVKQYTITLQQPASYSKRTVI